MCFCVYDDGIFCSERNTQKDRPKGTQSAKMLQYIFIYIYIYTTNTPTNYNIGITIIIILLIIIIITNT